MAIFDEKQLKQHIRKKEYLPVYLMIGDESYLKQYYTNLLVEKNIEPAFESFNFDRFEGKGLDIRDVYEKAMLMPMMSDKRCVVVDDFKLDSLNDKEVLAFEENLSNLPESTLLIFRQDSVPFSKKSGKKVMGLIEKFGAVCELNKRKGQELLKPLIACAQKQGCDLSLSMAQYLTASVGDDFNVLINELNKVCNFVGEGEITKADIDAVAVKTLDSKVYYLTNALLSKDFDKAYGVLDSLLRMKTEPEYILGAIIGSYVDMYRVKVSLASGVNPAELKNSFNYKGREFVLSNAQRDGKKLELAQIRSCLEALSEADMKLKSSRDNTSLIIEQVMVKLLLISNGEKV